MTTPSDAEIIAYALALLDAGIRPCALPQRLMIDYGITDERARRLAAAALKQRRTDERRAGNGSR